MNSKKIFGTNLCFGMVLSGFVVSANAAASGEAFSQDSPWMFGDWGGSRQSLQDQGVTFDASYISEMAFNALGGYDKNGKLEYADQFSFGTNFDLQKLAGISGADAQIIITNRNGENLTGQRLVDPRTGPVSSTMEVQGRGQIWRLTQMWYRQSFFDDKVNWKVGRVSPSEDFQSFPCDFQNLSFCAAQAGMWAGDDWYSYPVGQWGSRLRFSLSPEVQFQVGVYEHNRTLTEHDNGFKLSTSGSNGVILPVELIWSPQHALFGLPGEYRIGAYRMNINADDKFKDINGDPRALTGEPALNRKKRTGTWFMARQQVAHIGGDTNRPVEIFAQAHANDRDTSFVDRFYSAGVVATGPFESRPGDQLAFAVGRAHVNSSIKRSEELLNQAAGVFDYSDPAFTPEQTSEYMAEVYYGVKVNNWLTLRPNVQYLHNPGAVEEVDDAFVAGLKVIAIF